MFSLPARKGRTEETMDKFSNRKDISSIKRVNICYRHFADNLLKKISIEQSFYMNINPYPQSFQRHERRKIYRKNAIFETIETPKKPQRQKIFQEDHMKPLKKLDVIKYLDEINEEKMKSLDV